MRIVWIIVTISLSPGSVFSGHLISELKGPAETYSTNGLTLTRHVATGDKSQVILLSKGCDAESSVLIASMPRHENLAVVALPNKRHIMIVFQSRVYEIDWQQDMNIWSYDLEFRRGDIPADLPIALIGPRDSELTTSITAIEFADNIALITVRRYVQRGTIHFGYDYYYATLDLRNKAVVSITYMAPEERKPSQLQHAIWERQNGISRISHDAGTYSSMMNDVYITMHVAKIDNSRVLSIRRKPERYDVLLCTTRTELSYPPILEVPDEKHVMIFNPSVIYEISWADKLNWWRYDIDDQIELIRVRDRWKAMTQAMMWNAGWEVDLLDYDVRVGQTELAIRHTSVTAEDGLKSVTYNILLDTVKNNVIEKSVVDVSYISE